MDLSGLFWPFMGWMIVNDIFDFYVSFRQVRQVSGNKKPPKEIEGIATVEQFRKANHYSYDGGKFGLIHHAYNSVTNLLMLYFYLLPWAWNITFVYGKQLYPALTENGLMHSFLFMSVGAVFSTVTDLPWDMYKIFVIEEKHGFNKQTYGLFFTDQVKTLLLTITLGGGVMCLLIALIEWIGDWFWFGVPTFITVLVIVMTFVLPNFIMPLFNKYEPLEEGEIRTGIEKLAARLHFPLKKLYKVDGSKRSGHSNAYMYGLWKNKRIVLYDNLLDQMKEDPQQIFGVLAHELGHWSYGHTWCNLAIGIVTINAMLAAFNTCNTDAIYEMFGFTIGERKPTMIGLVLFMMFVWSPVETLLNFLMHILSRKFEYQADGFSVALGYADPLKAALIKLNIENKGSLDPDWLYSTLHHSHPPLTHRLRAINATIQGKKSR
eukprot:TRINITY_DN67399_c6_g4_i1.p1 TRINITY_DN67399_c6_g4~~TRINITY_DN67399_c6_g4_i1.p1  ORF type:complete len:434 (-),score=54.27 TRINITY_DN67399_c6_g4_i1:251-1552(-)